MNSANTKSNNYKLKHRYNPNSHYMKPMNINYTKLQKLS